MLRRVEVLRRVTVLRAIAAADVAALQAQAKVDPGLTSRKAVLTPGPRRRSRVAGFQEMLAVGALSAHAERLSRSIANSTLVAGRHAARSSAIRESLNGTRSLRNRAR